MMNTNMQIARFSCGIKLVNPAANEKNTGTGYTVSDLFNLPMCVHFTDQYHHIQHINKTAAELCGFLSEDDAIGRTLMDVSEKQSALSVIENCHEVMQSRFGKIYEEKVTRKDELINHCISVKLPWFNDQNKLIGVFGCTAVVGLQPLNTLFSKILEMGVLNQAVLNRYQLSKRQEECLQYLVAGYSTKEIAAQMNLSTRTVEHYLDAVRVKLNCKSRLALVKLACSPDALHSGRGCR